MNLGTRLALAIVTYEESLTDPMGKLRKDGDVLVGAADWQAMLKLARTELARRRRAQRTNLLNQNREHAR